jgi:hypothetical protein
MDPKALRDQLAKLHEELGRTRQVDPRSNELLAEIQKDIQRLLERDRSGGAAGASGGGVSGSASLPDRLEQVAVQFEADHPTLAASSRRLIDLLGQVGL